MGKRLWRGAKRRQLRSPSGCQARHFFFFFFFCFLTAQRLERAGVPGRRRDLAAHELGERVVFGDCARHAHLHSALASVFVIL